MSEDDETAKIAIKHAMKVRGRRHLIEEGAHAPAFIALSRPLASQGSEWKEKAENLERELQQCYKAQARLSEQLVVEVAEARSSKTLLQERDFSIKVLQNEATLAREECSKMEESLEEKIKDLDLMINENGSLKERLEEATVRARNAEAENKILIDHWMLRKMQDAERLNELQQCYKAQARLSEQLVVEVAEARSSKTLLQERDFSIKVLQNEATLAREECSKMEESLEEKIKDLDLMINENGSLKERLEEATVRARNAEAENKILIDNWMLRKMQDAERLNEGSEWKEKVESLERELQQCYKAQAQLSEQLVVEVAEARSSKTLLQERDFSIKVLQNEATLAREECSRLEESLEEKIKALDLMINENGSLKERLEEATVRARNAEAENKILIDRWMLQKMQDGERLNEGSEWKEKVESLERELQQCYKAQAQLSEQLVVEVAEARSSKTLLQERDFSIKVLQNEATLAREECSRLEESLEEKIKALDLMINENGSLKERLEEATVRARNAEAENKILIDRWMLQKMQDGERLNEDSLEMDDEDDVFISKHTVNPCSAEKEKPNPSFSECKTVASETVIIERPPASPESKPATATNFTLNKSDLTVRVSDGPNLAGKAVGFTFPTAAPSTPNPPQSLSSSQLPSFLNPPVLAEEKTGFPLFSFDSKSSDMGHPNLEFPSGGSFSLGTRGSDKGHTNLEFPSGGSFSLGTGGVDKSNRKFVRARPDKHRKK